MLNKYNLSNILFNYTILNEAINEIFRNEVKYISLII